MKKNIQVKKKRKKEERRKGQRRKEKDRKESTQNPHPEERIKWKLLMKLHPTTTSKKQWKRPILIISQLLCMSLEGKPLETLKRGKISNRYIIL